MLFNLKHMRNSFNKRKVSEGPFGSSLKTKSTDQAKDKKTKPTLPPYFLVIGLEASRAFVEMTA